MTSAIERTFDRFIEQLVEADLDKRDQISAEFIDRILGRLAREYPNAPQDLAEAAGERFMRLVRDAGDRYFIRRSHELAPQVGRA
jgi:hypothetical protein